LRDAGDRRTAGRLRHDARGHRRLAAEGRQACVDRIARDEQLRREEAELAERRAEIERQEAEQRRVAEENERKAQEERDRLAREEAERAEAARKEREEQEERQRQEEQDRKARELAEQASRTTLVEAAIGARELLLELGQGDEPRAALLNRVLDIEIEAAQQGRES
jgi:hypothetical protein